MTTEKTSKFRTIQVSDFWHFRQGIASWGKLRKHPSKGKRPSKTPLSKTLAPTTKGPQVYRHTLLAFQPVSLRGQVALSLPRASATFRCVSLVCFQCAPERRDFLTRRNGETVVRGPVHPPIIARMRGEIRYLTSAQSIFIDFVNVS